MPNGPDILKVIADNPALFEAVKQEVLKKFAIDTGSISVDQMTNEHMGEFLRARVAGIELVLAAFKEISHHRTVAEKKEGKNPAR